MKNTKEVRPVHEYHRVPMTNRNRYPGTIVGHVDERPRTVGAQVGFRSSDSRYEGNDTITTRWTAHLITHDVFDGEQVVDMPFPIAVITEVVLPDDTTKVMITMQGGGVGSRRHASADSVTAAQEHVMKWAGRRFRIPADGSRASDHLEARA